MDIEVDEPFWTVRRPELTFRFTVETGDEPGTLDDGDVLVTGPGGKRWFAVVLAMSKIQEILDRCRDTGENLNGTYLWMKGLVIVREPGVESMVLAVEDLYDTYGTLDGTLPSL
ncbi:hypothetical protein GCM10010269_35130 [Streptomyces humidus]|uniref:Uncharacterized protein n=1 Tax=Streptomyces humidus TaxID=52259 RepID=A0A918FXE7_9ACTN|nr:hypothetical protein [Streptomyces humidus]GGR93073.1 hypothetical protein GCM10010269_35130 [Streptomyces humidus]